MFLILTELKDFPLSLICEKLIETFAVQIRIHTYSKAVCIGTHIS